MDSVFKVLIIEDSFIERVILKNFLYEVLDSQNAIFEIFSSKTAIEGLGTLFIFKPNLVFIDTTLPEFSGPELAAYLKENEGRINEITSLPSFLLHENSEIPDSLDRFVVFSKDNKDFLKNLESLLKINLYKFRSETGPNIAPIIEQTKLTFAGEIRSKLQKHIYLMSNNLNKVSPSGAPLLSMRMRKYAIWFWLKLYTDFMFSVYLIFTGNIKDKNTIQQSTDFMNFRVMYYPRLVIGMTFFVVIIVEVVALVFGTLSIIR